MTSLSRKSFKKKKTVHHNNKFLDKNFTGINFTSRLSGQYQIKKKKFLQSLHIKHCQTLPKPHCMCTGRMPPHHMLFFYKAGKLVILTPAYSTEVTFLQCGFPLPARKLFFSACTEGSRWGHDIHIH